MTGSAILALGLCGCQTTAPSDITGALGDTADKSQTATSRNDLDRYRERFRANPDDADAALQYGKALRTTGQRSQAVAVLEQASIAHPGNKALLAGYGRALADNGNFQQAFDVLSQAHSPDDPDWRILSAQGAALDQLGRYDEARQYYASALRIAPDEPTVLSNLGLSYVLSKDLPKAEEVLRRAYDHARLRSARAGQPGRRGRPPGPHERGRDSHEGGPAGRAGAGERHRAEAIVVAVRARATGRREFARRKPRHTRLTASMDHEARKVGVGESLT